MTELLTQADVLVQEQQLQQQQQQLQQQQLQQQQQQPSPAAAREVYEAMAASLSEAWKDLNAQLDYRRMLLDQSIAFHQSASDVSAVLRRHHRSRRKFRKFPARKSSL